jgi:hypothetical protein
MAASSACNCSAASCARPRADRRLRGRPAGSPFRTRQRQCACAPFGQVDAAFTRARHRTGADFSRGGNSRRRCRHRTGRTRPAGGAGDGGQQNLAAGKRRARRRCWRWRRSASARRPARRAAQQYLGGQPDRAVPAVRFKVSSDALPQFHVLADQQPQGVGGSGASAAQGSRLRHGRFARRRPRRGNPGRRQGRASRRLSIRLAGFTAAGGRRGGQRAARSSSSSQDSQAPATSAISDRRKARRAKSLARKPARAASSRLFTRPQKSSSKAGDGRG